MHISKPSGAPPEIMLLFSTMMKIMINLKEEYDREALITRNLYVTWNNIETELRQTNGRNGINRGEDAYQKETFQLLLRNLYGTNKQKLLDFIDDVLLQIPETNLLKALRDELRTRLNALGFNNQTIDQMRIFIHEWRGAENHTNGMDRRTEIVTYHPKKIFIVHGQDEVSKFALYRILRELALEPIIISY